MLKDILRAKLKVHGRRRYLFLLIIVVLAGLFIWFWNCLPGKLFDDPLTAVLFSREGYLLNARIAEDGQWRFPRQGKLPDKYVKALLQFEDSRFYYHPGVDPFALVRALIMNIKAGKRVSGGSTLTMQVMRLSRKNPHRTYLEKIKEMILALRLEIKYSKEEILGFYAANAPFGGNIVGLDAASWFYFGRAPAQLSWAESALLAVLPNSPALIHPGKNRTKLKAKRDILLRKLKDKHIINELEYTLALQERVPRAPHSLPRLAPHLLDTLMKDIQPGTLQQPLFHATLSRNLQQRIAGICQDHYRSLLNKDIRNTAALVIDNRSAEVVAYIGNTGLDRDKESGQSVDIICSPRSTGSILKPFLYAAMLDSGDITPYTLVPDIPTQYKGFIPENYDRRYRGAVPAREALARSLNIPAVHMLRHYGIHRFYDFLKTCGLSTLNRPADEYGLTLVLGGAEATLFEITAAYAKLSQLAGNNRGKVYEIKVLTGTAPRQAKMANLGTGAAYLTLQALLEVTRPGQEGYWKSFNSSREIAWKTGTSYGLRDAWAIGVTPRYTVGIWAGNADGEGKAGLTGVSTAAPVLFDIFNTLDIGDWYEKPFLCLKGIDVCSCSGNRATEMCEPVTIEIPKESHFSQVCTNHRVVHLDAKGKYRVDSRCESTDRMVHKSWFVLPPVQEYYYRKYHPGYKKLPAYRADCKALIEAQRGQRVMNLEYPQAGTTVYIPVNLDGTMSRVVFRAVHRDPDTTIFWHLDDRYICATKTFHQAALNPGPGQHRLILVDENGSRLQRTFRVLGKGTD